MRRFYRVVDVVPDRNEFIIKLDQRFLKTPAKAELRLFTRSLADAVANEWRCQGDKIIPESMPFMRLAATAIDRVANRRAEIITEITAYGSTDLLCYRAAHPDDLVRRQEDLWQPQLNWLCNRYGIDLKVTTGVMMIVQDAGALAKIAALAEQQNDLRLTILHLTTSALGSVVLALALLTGEIDAEMAYALSQLDETYQIERWGEDHEAAKQQANLKRDIADYARFLALLS